MPQPLPALVDMYEAFKAINSHDVLKATDFLKHTLPHLLFPSSQELVWWHRCPEPLSFNVDYKTLLSMCQDKFKETKEPPVEDLWTVMRGREADEFEKRHSKSEYLGSKAQSFEAAMKLLNLNDQAASAGNGSSGDADDDTDCSKTNGKSNCLRR